MTRVLIMAGGTGGHVFPALAVAEELRAAGVEVLWLGTPEGIESRIVPAAGFAFEPVRIRGLRGKGILGWLLLPVRMARAMARSLVVIMRYRPKAVLGMGGFVSGPGGLVARLLHKPLLVHEQNALAGFTNRWLARIATRVLVAFEGSLPERLRPVVTGNPVRRAIESLPAPEGRFGARSGRLHLLVLGGSLGAQALNETVPEALAACAPGMRPEVWHQAGRAAPESVADDYRGRGIAARVEPFIEDMAAAYAWADLVVCRAGALTVSELAAAGVGAILVPYPYAVDDHQTHNARWLVEAGAARILQEGPDLARRIGDLLAELSPGGERDRLLDMARAARARARPGAASLVSRHCLEVAHA